MDTGNDALQWLLARLQENGEIRINAMRMGHGTRHYKSYQAQRLRYEQGGLQRQLLLRRSHLLA